MIIHGWTVAHHVCFDEQLRISIARVTDLAHRKPHAYRKTRSFALLAAISKYAFDVIPRDPADPRFRQRAALGVANTGWFRAKFLMQYRLFFRYSVKEKVIIYAWVNDETTLRAYESKQDAYRVFAKMLEDGRPPADWDALKKEREAAADVDRMIADINGLLLNHDAG